MMDAQRETHKIKNTIEPVPDMKRDVAHHTMALFDKLDRKEFETLEAHLENDFPSMEQFTKINAVVSAKAEWLDLNELSRYHDRTVTKLDGQIMDHKELNKIFNEFKDKIESKAQASEQKTGANNGLIMMLQKSLKSQVEAHAAE